MKYLILILMILCPLFSWGQINEIPAKQLDIGALKSPEKKASLAIADFRTQTLLPSTDIKSGLFFSIKRTDLIGISQDWGLGASLFVVPWDDDSGNDNIAYRLTSYNNNLYYSFYNSGSWGNSQTIATQEWVNASVSHEGSYVLQKSIDAGLFSSNAGSSGKEVLDYGTIGSD